MFRLLRYFSIMSACAIAALTAVFVVGNTWHKHTAFVRSEQQHAATIAQSIYNTALANFEAHIKTADGLTRQDLLARPETLAIDQAVSDAVQGTDILKIKIIGPSGLMLYSSEHAQIGKVIDHRAIVDTVIATGQPNSEIEYGRDMMSFTGLKSGIDTLGTYALVRNASGAPVTVIEIYSDITAALANQRQDRLLLAGLLVSGCILLYIALFAIVARADAIMARQHADLEAFNGDLEKVVAERTATTKTAVAATVETNRRLQTEIEERRGMEGQLLAQRERLLRQQGVLGELIRSNGSVQEDWQTVIASLMETATSTLEASRSGVWLYTQDRTELTAVDLFNAQDQTHDRNGRLTVDASTPYFQSLLREASISARDARSDPRLVEFADYFARHDIASVLDVPIVRGGRVAGVFSLGQVGAVRDWQPEDHSFASTMASLVALVLESRDRLEVERQLRATNEELEKATRVKSEFLATMSHEIRTPMNGVLGMLTLLSREQLAPPHMRLAGVAKQSAENLLTILNDVLDYSKLEGGNVGIESVDFDLQLLLQEARELLAPRAEAKGLRLSLNVTEHLPPLLGGDPTRLRQVLLNLIGNAIKFTEHGSVQVDVTMSAAVHDVNVRIAVTDTGIGIAEDNTGRLFARFSQGDASMTRRFGGTGLGLAISRQLVELMGGHITFTSTVGVGSCFTLEVPLRRVDATAVDASTAPVVSLPQGLRVLAVDDNHVNQLIVEMLLLEQGCTVELASNGLEALAAAKAQTYDVVLMDIQMPEMDGLSATRAIRNLPMPACRVPVIALTANAMPGDRDSYLAAGMNGYASKPIREADFFAEINRVLAIDDRVRAVA